MCMVVIHVLLLFVNFSQCFKPKLLLLDEPFAGIDSVSEDIIMQTLKTLKKEGKTILIVHHDLSKVPAYFDQVLLLHRKLIAFGKTEETFTKENLHAAYGHELFIGGGVG